MHATLREDTPHGRRRFSGRDPEEVHRASTPLELLFDLTIVVGFGTAADQLASHVAAGHVAAGVVGFCLAAFAVSWAWLNYTWFASAYDTEDWVFRAATMVQMVGVIVLSLGLAPMFASIEHGEPLDIGVVVAGYVVMRIALVALWWLVSRHDRARAPAARAYMRTIGLVQVGWVALAVARLPLGVTLAGFAGLMGLELLGPLRADRAAPIPWHPEHIAERYGLLVIITLGEVLLGTVASLNAVVHGPEGWSVDAALVALAGVGLAFGCWWVYFSVPWAAPLARHRERAFAFGYGHLVLFAALAAMGGGLRVAADALEGRTALGTTATILAVAVPLAIYCAVVFALYSALMRTYDPLHAALGAATVVLVALAVGLAAAGASVAVCLVVLALVPVVTVVGYETLGHRHVTEHLQGL